MTEGKKKKEKKELNASQTRTKAEKVEQTDGGVKKEHIYAKFKKNKGIKGMSQTR